MNRCILSTNYYRKGRWTLLIDHDNFASCMSRELRSIFACHFCYTCTERARVGYIGLVGDDVRTLRQEVDEDAVLGVFDVVVVAYRLTMLDTW